MVARPKEAPSRVHLSPYLRGVIYGLLLAGWTYQEIADEVEKPDGEKLCQQSVATVASQAKSRGGLHWDGQSASSTSPDVGRPRSTTEALDKAIVKLVFKHRGRVVVTVQYIQKMVRAARKVSARTISRRLGDAGLAWLRRRRKSLVPQAHKVFRLDWAAWVLARTATTLGRWAYTDGTVFYLARSQTELESSTRAALGPSMWRQTDGSDALYEECVGPSSYWKAQGTPVRIWGLLVAGVLFIYVLAEDKVMNRWEYAWLIEHKFPTWLQKGLGRRRAKQGAFLVQDHEKCLWTEEARSALIDQGITLLENYPKCSQDLNPIETAWRELRARLYVTQPFEREYRDDFIRRLRCAVVWINTNRKGYLKNLCLSQKQLATDVIDAEGSRTKH
jgi:hypothetical protein